MKKNWVKFTAIITISAIVGSACAVFTYNNIPEPEFILIDTLAAKNKVSCEKISELPAMYRCKLPEGVVCYIVQTGISCLPMGTQNGSLSDWGLGPAKGPNPLLESGGHIDAKT